MKEHIIRLRNEGKSYLEIKNELGCSKGTISYHCGSGQKDKTRQRTKKFKKTLNGILRVKKDSFSCIKGNRKCAGRRVSLPFSIEKFRAKLEGNPICYLTGRTIDLTAPRTYHCDHIIPVALGGKGTLANLGLTCKDANIAKAALPLNKFLELCKEILVFNGYTVTRKIN